MPIGPNGERLPYPSGFGGDIPSPRQKGDGNVRRPSSAGGNRDAMIRAYMAAMQGAVPQEPTFSDIPNMTPEQIAPYNKPAMDINDAFFGPDRKPFQWTDVVDFLTKFSGGK